MLFLGNFTDIDFFVKSFWNNSSFSPIERGMDHRPFDFLSDSSMYRLCLRCNVESCFSISTTGNPGCFNHVNTIARTGILETLPIASQRSWPSAFLYLKSARYLFNPFWKFDSPT